MWNSTIRQSSILAAAVLLVASSLWGQAGGTIRGTLLDPTGAMVARARVIADNIETGIQTPALSTEAGNYNIPNLPPGVYRVEVEKAGFKRLVRDNVIVPVGVTIGLDLTLEVGPTTQTVEVTAQAPQLEKESSDLRTN